MRPRSSVVVKVSEGDEYLNVIGQDHKGELLLATWLLPDVREISSPLVRPSLRLKWEVARWRRGAVARGDGRRIPQRLYQSGRRPHAAL